MIRLENVLQAYEGDFAPLSFDFSPECIPESYRQEILRQAAAYGEQPYPPRLATGFLAFVRSGSRKADEDPYFFRRRKLCYATLACFFGEKQYLDDVIDGIWCICEESSWVISAHNVNAIPGAPRQEDYPLPDPERPYVDLFSAQTGMILTLVRQLLQEQLDQVTPLLGQRISQEIHRRILDPFMTTDEFWWMGFLRKDLCNWTPWIVSNVMLCGLSEPLDQQTRNALMPRAFGMIDRWLDCVPEDGGCDEGAGYWNMAGGALLDCLEMLEESTGGKITFWGEEKIRNILSFPAKAEIGNGYFLNFADCDVRPYLSGERIQTAGEKLGIPSLISLGGRLRTDPTTELSDVPHFIRMLKMLFHPAAPAADFQPLSDIWLPDLQVRILRRGGWTLAAKGGHNGESHNHNDVGSFMLYLDGQPEIVDAGNMTYTAKTFSHQRYELWNTRTAYHNLPLLGGKEQLAGCEYRARETESLPEGLKLDLAAAYDPEAKALSCVRRLTLTEEGACLSDEIQLAEAKPVTWVFLLRNRPILTAEGLEAGRIQMRIPEGYQIELEEIPITDPRMARNWPGSLWRVQITDGSAEKHQACWQIRRK